ncbi:MAG: cache domain-containing protein, partial [Clostridia bacterium]|nr:cache domain-containing protein [Clostridia bacterium]
MKNERKNLTVRIAVIGGIIVAVILVIGTIWMGQSARRDTDDAARSVSLLYLDELAGRRGQVVEETLNDDIGKIRVAVELMTDEDLSDIEHLQAYQARMKKLYDLEKFAFVDTDGLIYTSRGTQTNIDDYQFEHTSLEKPEISIVNTESTENRKVVIAVPVDRTLGDKRLTVCFMEIDMAVMLGSVSVTQNTDSTYCNIYTADGIPLSNQVLAGTATESNLFDALANASFREGYSLEQVRADFVQKKRGIASFNYNGAREMLSYVPVKDTDWFLTYLIREKVISDRIG